MIVQKSLESVARRVFTACNLAVLCASCTLDVASYEDVADIQQRACNLTSCDPPLVKDGFWQEDGGPRVYWLYNGRICWVRDPGMLMALRWTTTPQYTPSNYSVTQLRFGRVDEGACMYPDAVMLKTYDSDWVYKMTGGAFCHVRNQTQLAEFGGWSKVLIMQKPRKSADYSEGGGVIGEGSWNTFGARRLYTGDCKSPQQP
jgi:hypothetical protein